MRKSNFITLSVLCVMMIAVVIFAFVSGFHKANKKPPEVSAKHDVADTALPSTETGNPATENTDEPNANPAVATENTIVPDTEPALSAENTEPAAMTDALFIGDSRTVGIMEYAGLEGADFFCSTGMNVFEVRAERVSAPGVGKVTLSELLTGRKYGKIYIMLGINELGCDFQSILDAYHELIAFVEAYQKDAVIFVQANLHVSKKRSESDKYFNNPAIDKLNLALSGFADNDKIFFLDGNDLFDDKDGCLSADKTSDDTHLYAKYYAEWGEWIGRETAKYKKQYEEG